MKWFIGHNKVPGGFNRWRRSFPLWSVLDLPEHQLHCAPDEQRKREEWKIFSSQLGKDLKPWRINPSHRLRTLASWLSALNALISNSTAHCYRRREKKNHHPVTSQLHHHESSVRFLPCQHHGALAEEPLSKVGCRETEKQRNAVSGNQPLCALRVILYGRG